MKSPLQFGAVKMGMGALNWGLGVAQSMGLGPFKGQGGGGGTGGSGGTGAAGGGGGGHGESYSVRFMRPGTGEHLLGPLNQSGQPGPANGPEIPTTPTTTDQEAVVAANQRHQSRRPRFQPATAARASAATTCGAVSGRRRHPNMGQRTRFRADGGARRRWCSLWRGTISEPTTACRGCLLRRAPGRSRQRQTCWLAAQQVQAELAAQGVSPRRFTTGSFKLDTARRSPRRRSPPRNTSPVSTVQEHGGSDHWGLFQEQGNYPGAHGTADDQIDWFINEMGKQGGPAAANADPANFIANHVERGGYSGSNYNLGGAQALINGGGGPSQPAPSQPMQTSAGPMTLAAGGYPLFPGDLEPNPGATDTATSGLARYGAIPSAHLGNRQNIIGWMEQQVQQYNQATGSNLSITATYPGGHTAATPTTEVTTAHAAPLT